MLRFVVYALPLLLLVFALFGALAETLALEPRTGAVIRLALFTDGTLPGRVVFGTWLLEACGLTALFLLLRGRTGGWWLDGLAAGWTAWIFRGPLLVITVVVATGQRQEPWWSLALAWWVLYGVCGLLLGLLARRTMAPAPRSAPPATESTRPAPPVPEPTRSAPPASEVTMSASPAPEPTRSAPPVPGAARPPAMPDGESG